MIAKFGVYCKPVTKQGRDVCLRLVTFKYPFSSFTANSQLCVLMRKRAWINKVSQPDS